MQYVLGNMLNGGGINPDGLSLDLQFAADKTLTARKGPTPTFTRASGATQVGAAGLIEFAPENLLLQSENFGTTWAVNNALTVTPNAVSAPDGTLTADALNFDSNASTRILQFAGSAAVHTFSVWLRADAATTCILTTTAAGSAGNDITASVTTTWQRFSVVSTTWVTGTASFTCRIVNNVAGTTGTIYAWGAQLERHTSARDYIPTTTAAVYNARFDHNPTTLASLGLLIEESRTNLLQRSEELDNAYWIKTTTTVGGAEASPSGAITADVITASVGAGRHIIQRTMAFTAASHTFSIFIKKGSNRWAQVMIADNFGGSFGIIVDLDTGLVTDSRITSVSGTSSLVTAFPNGWYRVSATVSASAGTWYAIVALSNAAVPSYDVNNNPSFIALGTETIFAWGAQLEAGSFPTSYIPTTTGSVVRSADVCSITGGNFSGFWNRNEGTIFASGSPRSGAIVIANTGSNANQVSHYISSNLVSFGVANSGNYTALLTLPIVIGSFVKTSGAYATNDARSSVNGLLSTQDTSVIVPTNLNRFNIGSGGSANSEFCNGHISEIKYFRKPLPDAKLQALTA